MLTSLLGVEPAPIFPASQSQFFDMDWKEELG